MVKTCEEYVVNKLLELEKKLAEAEDKIKLLTPVANSLSVEIKEDSCFAYVYFNKNYIGIFKKEDEIVKQISALSERA